MQNIKLLLKIPLFLLTGLLLLRCIPEPLEVKGIPDHEPEIVVSSQLSPDGSLVIWLTRTFSALEISEDSKPEEVLEQIALDDAMVTIAGPERTDTLEWIEGGLYGGLSLSLQEGPLYELRVNSETLGEVEAMAKVQPAAKFEEVEVELYKDIYDDTLAEVAFSFRDLPGRNFYMLNVQPVGREEVLQNVINPDTYTLLLDDNLFVSDTYQDEIYLDQNKYAPGDTIAVSLSIISPEYYQFMELQQEKQLDFISFLSEPFNYPSNVQGGKGFFQLSSPDTRIFIFQRVK